MHRMVLVLLCSCHLLDDGVIAVSCEDLAAECEDAVLPDTADSSSGDSDETGIPRGPELVSWEVSDFGDQILLAENGWENGYPEDQWYAEQGKAWALTDDGLEEAEKSRAYVYGMGGSPDNWLLHPGSFAHGAVQASLTQSDDDFCGIVIGHDGHASFVLLGASKDKLPPPEWQATEPVGFLILVIDGQVVDSVVEPIQGWGNDAKTSIELSLRQADGLIVGAVDDQEFSLSAQPLLGQAGLYAYESGAIPTAPESCVFTQASAAESAG